MKYIMMETDKGQKLPVIFPDVINHSMMAQVIAFVTARQMDTFSRPVSAGFVHFAQGSVGVDGESESLGGLPSHPNDAIRIWAGESVAFMPDAMVETLMHKAKKSL